VAREETPLTQQGLVPAEWRQRQRVDYAALPLALEPAEAGGVERLFEAAVPDWLVRRWTDAYRTLGGAPEIVEVTESGFHYLFDVAGERAIAGYGVSRTKQTSPRDASRMAGFPRSEAGYHKGHLVAHSLGGGLDINLFHQLGAANIGPFRRLEREAARNPGSLYCVRLLYASPSLTREAPAATGGSADGQRPKWVEQGLILPRAPLCLTLREFEN
jgi:hypothetical protein